MVNNSILLSASCAILAAAAFGTGAATADSGGLSIFSIKAKAAKPHAHPRAAHTARVASRPQQRTHVAHRPPRPYATARARPLRTAGHLTLVPQVVVSQGGSGGYHTIAEGLMHVASGGTVLLQPGIYDESLVLTRSVTLEAAPASLPNSVVIESSGQPCLTLSAPAGVIKGITFQNRELSDQPASVMVDILQGRATLRDCDIGGGSTAALSIRGAAARPHIVHCTIHDGGQTSLFVGDSAWPTIDQCSIAGTKRATVEIASSGNPILSDCHIVNTGSSGDINAVYLSDNARGTLERCTMSCAISSAVWADASATTFSNCVITGSGRDGFTLEAGSNCVIDHCDVAHCAWTGIAADNCPMNLTNDTVHDNGGTGILGLRRAVMTVTGCNVFGNGDDLVHVSGSSGAFSQCKLHDCTRPGFVIDGGGSAAVIDGCEVWNTGAAGVDSDGSAVTIRDSRFHDLPDTGLYLEQGGSANIDHVSVDRTVKTAVHIGPQTGATLTNCTVQQAGDNGLEFAQASAATASGCTIANCKNAAVYADGIGARVEQTTISGCGSPETTLNNGSVQFTDCSFPKT